MISSLSVDKQSLTIATMNPGRTGFAALGTNALLFWRLWALDLELHERRIRFCVVPGARLPPGVSLPAGFHYAWRGLQTISWAAVGVFIHLDLEDRFSELSEYGDERLVWFRVFMRRRRWHRWCFVCSTRWRFGFLETCDYRLQQTQETVS